MHFLPKIVMTHNAQNWDPPCVGQINVSLQLMYIIIYGPNAVITPLTARCKELPPDPEHGFVIAPKNDHGSRAKFVCRDGYVIEGDNITTCTYGEWTGTVPRCKIGKK